MHHKEIIQKSISVVNQRGQEYGEASQSFIRIATIASTILNRAVTAYDVSAILLAVKLGRISNDRTHEDSFVDGINYLAFMHQFADSKLPKAVMEDRLAEVQGGLIDAVHDMKGAK